MGFSDVISPIGNSPLNMGDDMFFRWSCWGLGLGPETRQVDHDLDELPEEAPEEPRQPTPALPPPPMAPLAPFLSALTLPSPEEDEEIPEAAKGSNLQGVGDCELFRMICEFFCMEFGNYTLVPGN